MIDYKKMIGLANTCMQNSYSPYSHFKVGACVLTKSGKYFVGTNIENASFGATICAERSAISSAISQGEKDFACIAIVSSSGEYTPPCGICRQVLSEFGDLEIVLAKDENNFKVYTLKNLLPNNFAAGDIK